MTVNASFTLNVSYVKDRKQLYFDWGDFHFSCPVLYNFVLPICETFSKPVLSALTLASALVFIPHRYNPCAAWSRLGLLLHHSRHSYLKYIHFISSTLAGLKLRIINKNIIWPYKTYQGSRGSSTLGISELWDPARGTTVGCHMAPPNTWVICTHSSSSWKAYYLTSLIFK